MNIHFWKVFMSNPMLSQDAAKGGKSWQGLPRSTMVWQGQARSNKGWQGLVRADKVW